MNLRAAPLALLLSLAACSAPAPQAPEPGAQPAAATPAPAASNVLTLQGIGPVQLGMRVAEAEQALQTRFTPMEPEESEACWTARRADGKGPNVNYMVEDGRITRIGIPSTIDPAGPDSEVKTAEGIAIGSAERDVLAAYGPATQVTPHKYDENGHYLLVDSPDAKSALIFETSAGIVTTFRAGFHPAVDYVEDCL